MLDEPVDLYHSWLDACEEAVAQQVGALHSLARLLTHPRAFMAGGWARALMHACRRAAAPLAAELHLPCSAAIACSARGHRCRAA